MKLSGKFIRRLLGILSTVLPLCVLIVCGLMLQKIVPLYKSVDKFKNINCQLSSSSSSSSSRLHPGGNKSELMNGNKNFTKILLAAETAVEDALDLGGVITRRRKRRSSKKLRKKQECDEIDLMNSICLDEWSRYIGLSIGAIILSLVNIVTSLFYSWTASPSSSSSSSASTTQTQESSSEKPPPSSIAAVSTLMRTFLCTCLWLFLGLSLYSSHCIHGDFRVERLFFAIFVAIDAAILSLPTYVKITNVRGAYPRHHYQYRFFYNLDDEDEDIQNVPASFQQLSELQT